MSSGLHNLVNELRNELRYDDCRFMSMYEEVYLNTYKEIKIAYQYFCEIGHIPNTYYKHSEIDFVKEMDKKFRKELICTNYKRFKYYNVMKTYLKQQIKHYERLYLAYRIARYMIEEWEIDDVEYFGQNVLDKNWIKKYNESLEK